ncbi:hypothetical protein N7517_005817 [Penicillium concentricum]|uniref:Aminoglycoside phosphotransferase domain-containing protein n=1 Tax=Penicillium concentricum TaxID=293559 RepID=A0A9W9VBY6_9EURO|nr:uncharacterized protein N7517_005817 [Penicillium concentricum]KAJ5373811.1 hypothetical protein N7517_005817 [Penicillium concentricum]
MRNLRTWPSDDQNICSDLGTSLRSPVLKFTEMSSTIIPESPQTRPRFNRRITFTHGDFKANILVGDGHLSAFLDWESAHWYPEYRDSTSAMRYGKSSWWSTTGS